MEHLFNSKYAERPTWLCAVLMALVLSASFIVATDLAGVLDFVLRVEQPKEVKEINLDADAMLVNGMIHVAEKRANRGAYSYYLEAYPFIMCTELKDTALDVGEYVHDMRYEKAKLTTQAEKDAFDKANNPKIEKYVAVTKAKVEELKDRLALSSLTMAMYRILSVILALWILKIPTGMSTKILYWLGTRKTRWVF